MINQFKALVTKRGGLSKTNRFDIIVSLPPGITSADDRGRDLTLLCESASLPGKQITTIEWALYGHPSKVPSGFLYEDVNLIFNITSDYYVKKIFDEWQLLSISEETYNVGYDSDYKADMIIRQLDEQDNPIYSVKLKGAYPITVQSIMLDNNSDGSTQKLSVTMTYSSLKHL